jgi:hypothetical protein
VFYQGETTKEHQSRGSTHWHNKKVIVIANHMKKGSDKEARI